MTYRNAKKIYFTMVTAITVSAFMVICTLGQAVRQKKVETRLAAAAIEQDTPEYTVREYGGRAVVFRCGSDEPYIFIDVDMSLLSDVDRQQLSKGISFDTEHELRQFIEDISS
ncbi:hypothetical protein [Ruminococcus sp.]|jgi:hypothetical protein|uniref:hypothetical protein n=1 Tax=Ruminococcus sp. TaxID=41978 RepID=UPI0025FDC93A|nr:hypothetical protein [Ruminococcus sp.]